MINWITMFIYIVTKYTVVFQRLLACDALPICDVIGSDKSPILYLEFDWLLGHHGWASPKEWLIVQCWRSVSVYYYLAWLWSPHWSQWPVHPVASGIHGSIPRISLVIIWDFVVTGSFFFCWSGSSTSFPTESPFFIHRVDVSTEAFLSKCLKNFDKSCMHWIVRAFIKSWSWSTGIKQGTILN